MANCLPPLALSDTTIQISGKGNWSNNTVDVTNNDTTNVTQLNSFNVNLDISSKASTGKNEANNNNGGNITIDTGNATSNVTVAVQGGSNVANLPCGCTNTTDNVTISGNGNNSDNNTTVTNKKKKKVTQTNTGGVGGPVKSKAKTGKNKANGNNQSGDVNVTTGNSNSTVDVNVTAPSNEVNVTP